MRERSVLMYVTDRRTSSNEAIGEKIELKVIWGYMVK